MTADDCARIASTIGFVRDVRAIRVNGKVIGSVAPVGDMHVAYRNGERRAFDSQIEAVAWLIICSCPEAWGLLTAARGAASREGVSVAGLAGDGAA